AGRSGARLLAPAEGRRARDAQSRYNRPASHVNQVHWMNLSGIGYDRCPMEPNALYYTLSTIAQTLAGALAVLVAVVLFKLAALASAMAPGKEMLGDMTNLQTTWPILVNEGLEALAEHLRKDGDSWSV